MTKVFLGLGSNMGDKVENIARAINFLQEKIINLVSAPLYDSKAWGVTEQPDFINTAVMGETELLPEELLFFVKAVEKHVGRVERYRWGPREIDVDILFYGDLIYQTEKLQIPHTGVQDRDSVLVPMMDLAPNFIHPVFQQTVAKLLAALPAEKRSITGLHNSGHFLLP